MTHPPIAEQDPAERIVNWARTHRTQLTAAVVFMAVVAGGAWFWFSAKQRRESFAQSALADARAAVIAGNNALAVSDLSRLMTSYSGTTAAGEAAILLGQIRLMEGQAPLAITDLRQFIAGQPLDQFLGPARGLLAVALEETGAWAEAAQEYLAAAESSWYDGVQAQFLLDAARVMTIAGDTATAISTYQRVVDDYAETGTEVEARVRLSELQATTPSGRSES